MTPIVLMLPAYNEEKALPPLLERARVALEGWPYRVVVVDDGSDDETARVAEEWAGRLPLTLVRRKRNGGLGAAMASGLWYARTNFGPEFVLVTMDGDNTHDPALIPSMVGRIEDGADLVVASRFVLGATTVGVPWERRLLSGGARLLFGRLLGIQGVRDYTCGYRAYRMALVHGLARRFRPLVRARGFAVMTELLAKAAAEGARCEEVPLALRYDLKPGRSKLRVLPTLGEYGRVLLLARVDIARTAPSRSRVTGRTAATG
ncbi:MAG TPA: glycosyltransferase [Chloroflexota bacterium]|jgi:dolichol-phosphate mannosyltransferase|nr:glycosyltransferase [Chloroflexota bacterium]